MTGEPVGMNCPGCGEEPVWVFGNGTQAWCWSDDCPVLTWDPTKTLAENNAGATQVDLRPKPDQGG